MNTPNQLEQLKRHTTVVADTGDFLQMTQYQPQDATTNPSLILKAIQQEQYRHFLTHAVQSNHTIEATVDAILVRFGCEILQTIPGRVSTEVDARLSFDTQATIERAKHIIETYQKHGIDANNRVLIKIAATWEGIQAAKALQTMGIQTNVTLLFSMCQAVAAADAKAKLISPFVGRIGDWHKKNQGNNWKDADNLGVFDLGVQSVTAIHNHYKTNGIQTQIMGASFRNTAQIAALSGCDFLTISPELMAQLLVKTEPMPRILQPKPTTTAGLEVDVKVATPNIAIDESAFRLTLNQDAMATEKLAEGIRAFCMDAQRLDALINQHKAAR